MKFSHICSVVYGWIKTVKLYTTYKQVHGLAKLWPFVIIFVALRERMYECIH